LEFCQVADKSHGLPENSPLLEIPPVGLHYKELWYQQDQAELEGHIVDADDPYGANDDGQGDD